MNHLRKFNESKDEELISEFEDALKNGRCSFNEDYYGNNKKLKELHLYDDYYQYRGYIFQTEKKSMPTYWYHSDLVRLKIEPQEFRDKLFDRIEELESALEKIKDY